MNLYELPETTYERTEDLWTPINRLKFLSRFDPLRWPQIDLVFRTAEEYRKLKQGEQIPIQTRLTINGYSLDPGNLTSKVLEKSREQSNGNRVYLASFTLSNHGHAQVSGNLHKTRFSWDPESELEEEVYKLIGFALRPEQGLPKDKIDEFLKEIKLRRAEKLRRMEQAEAIRKPLKPGK